MISLLKKLYFTFSRSSRIIITLVIIDQLTKWWFINNLRWKPGLMLKVTSVLNMVYTWNYGISFGLMREYYQYSNTIFLITNMIIVCYLYYLMICSKTIGSFAGYSFVIGGAIGNLIDRFCRGAVFDFIHFHYRNYSFPVFNLADCFITLGVIILMEDYFSTKKVIEETSKGNYDNLQIEVMAEKIRHTDHDSKI
ncbi:signal peptidase II [Rickettsia prowazekii]|uniref:Lipoprotein signal peptidase n=2 Tax=Rickettsia prowazekii TaxID=782 RepID=LSPA_RICPR|nr:signal peptidase II [Rickettsia prowazekii]Q9ZDC4.1 RecName: Full=Lipoprotein signal peptidase; AltName: Full=Prolipoprotein signal peptidase; AltName: Full=Signal peptidase II; Short=SPase II [Rickettsia prowazekii str. Madrid E]EOB09774.1 Lipoprotein signal peptidase [Rickettsia prowazekii str. GvF12]ADE29935.1 Lipoprotein signal peptidase [Rickettsia prowazekii str. Rp22]AFE49221.1 lipoprotein signal peptidase [Rickettsia prowazekii str. Chernikova]AFE50067.1 lipoprotein signal peptidase